jgi:hypothetical protein
MNNGIQIVKDPLSFEVWIFRNGQPDCDDDRIIFIAMISTTIIRITYCSKNLNVMYIFSWYD